MGRRRGLRFSEVSEGCTSGVRDLDLVAVEDPLQWFGEGRMVGKANA